MENLQKISYYKKGNKEWGEPLEITGVEDKLENLDITLFPNPAQDEVKIQNNSHYINLNLKIFNLMGQEVPVSVKQEGWTYQVDIQELGADVYILEVNSLNTVKRYKVQKQ